MPYPAALLLTLLIEVPLYVALLAAPADRRPAFVAAIGANLVTHPTVWFVLDRADASYWLLLAIAEVAAVMVEALLLVGCRRFGAARHVATVATLANAASCLAGLLWMAG